MNQSKVLVFALCFICSISSFANSSEDQDPYYFIRTTDLGKLPTKLRAKYHKELTNLLVKLESGEKYPQYSPSKFSSIQIFDKLLNTLVSECVASDNQSNACLFGGWVSRRNGSCSRPWGGSSKAMAESMDVPSYNSDYFCGADNLFRCNPLMFGPGLDQGLVGNEFPQINGNKNNSDPYSQGICVDVSRGYNGLSEKCQATSERLDEIRKEKGMPLWRESSFFDDEKAKDFSKLQEIVADKCAQNAERLNKDNTCNSLNRSLAMTSAAVLAGNIDGITPKQLFADCENYKSTALPRCDEDVNSDFTPMISAMEELRQSKNCSFMGVQAIDGDSLSHSFENPTPECRSSVVGALKTTGFGHVGAQNFSFFFVGANNQQLGNITAKISKEMSKEAIMAALSSGANQEAFNRYCNNSVCPRNENPTLKNLYGALDKLKDKKNCNIGSVHAVDFATQSSGIYEHSQCGLSVEGALGSEGLMQEDGKHTKISITLKDKKGVFLNQTHIEITPDMSADQIMALIPEQEVAKACVGSNVADRTDGEAAVADLGISEKTYIPTYWKDKLDDIRNLAEAQDPALTNFRVEVDDYGDLKLYADDVMAIQGMRTQLENILNSGRTDGKRFNFVGSESMDYVLLEGAPASAAVESIAHRKGINLTDEQRSLLEEVGSEQPLRDINVDAKGILTFATVDPRGDGPLLKTGEEYNGYSVLTVSERDEKLYEGAVKALQREYKLDPINTFNGMQVDLELRPVEQRDPTNTFNGMEIDASLIGCVPEGNAVPVSPLAPSCCAGLTLKRTPAGVMGSAGTCVKPTVR